MKYRKVKDDTKTIETIKSKSQPVTEAMVLSACKSVKRGGKSAGIDEVSFTDFEKEARANLYKIWNRMASGSYFPPAVKEVEIPKTDGSKRKPGIPTIGDRIAQTVVKEHLNNCGYFFYKLNQRLIKWAMNRHKRLRSKKKAIGYLRQAQSLSPQLFTHWKYGFSL